MAKAKISDSDRQFILIILSILYGEKVVELKIGHLNECLRFFEAGLKEGLSRSKSLEFMAKRYADEKIVDAHERVVLCYDILNLATKIDNDIEEKNRMFWKVASIVLPAIVLIVVILVLVLQKHYLS